MGELMAFSQPSLTLFLKSPRQGQFPIGSSMASLSFSISKRRFKLPSSYAQRNRTSWRTGASVVSDSKAPTIFTTDSPGKGIEILLDSGGSDDSYSGPGGGGGGDNGGNDESGETEGQGNDDGKKQQGMSMSQKLTLGYAALVGLGGVMGFLKGGSRKSLIAGGVSAALLCAVYGLLPSNPAVASSLGFALAASLLGVMGSRFKKSGKIFPAGIVSGASLVMAGGYLHGILRTLH